MTIGSDWPSPAFDHVLGQFEIYEPTRFVGLIGWPGEAWPSPLLYNAAFGRMGLRWRCLPLPVVGGRLREALRGLRALGFAGAELSEPYQSAALEFVDLVSPASQAIGAVKFVRVDERGQLVGDDLRWLGFMAMLRTLVPSLYGLRPLVIGAGTVASSIVYALTREGLPLTVADQSIDRAIDMVHRLRHVLDEHSFSVYRWPQDLARAARDANLIVNATSTGAWPDLDRSPWPDDLPFAPDAVIFDLASWPGETRFLRQARASGARAVSGLMLLVYEAAFALEMWTGQPCPIEGMWQVAEHVAWWPGGPPVARAARPVLKTPAPESVD
jgi:shikimate dehydrogenase